MMTSQSIHMDWNAINGFKNLINKENYYDPFVVGGIQKFLVETFRNDLTRNIFSDILLMHTAKYTIPINTIEFYSNNCYFDIRSNRIIEDDMIIEALIQFICNLLNSNIHLLKLSQVAICTMNQIALMDDNILRGYLKRSICLYRFVGNNEDKTEFILHLLPKFNY